MDLYRCVHDLLEQDYSDISEETVQKSCLKFKIDSNGYTMTGFNHLVRQIHTTPVGPGIVDYISEWDRGMRGRAYTTLTDNKSYLFTVCCYSDNQVGWNIFSSTPTMSSRAVKEVREHAISLGFSPDHFAGLNYDRCGEYGWTK